MAEASTSEHHGIDKNGAEANSVDRDERSSTLDIEQLLVARAAQDIEENGVLELEGTRAQESAHRSTASETAGMNAADDTDRAEKTRPGHDTDELPLILPGPSEVHVPASFEGSPEEESKGRRSRSRLSRRAMATIGVAAAGAALGAGVLIGSARSGMEDERGDNAVTDSGESNSGLPDQESSETDAEQREAAESLPSPEPNESSDVKLSPLLGNIDLNEVDNKDLLTSPYGFEQELTKKSPEAEEAVLTAIENGNELMCFRAISSMDIYNPDEDIHGKVRWEQPYIINIDNELYFASVHSTGQVLTYKVGRYDTVEERHYFGRGLQVHNATFKIKGREESGMFTFCEPESLTSEGIEGVDVWQDTLRENYANFTSRAIITAGPWSGVTHQHTGEQILLLPPEEEDGDFDHMFSDWIKIRGESPERATE